MSVVEASDASDPFDESVQYLESTNPLVEGEVLTSEVPENPIPVDEAYEKWLEAQLATSPEPSMP